MKDTQLKMRFQTIMLNKVKLLIFTALDRYFKCKAVFVSFRL